MKLETTTAKNSFKYSWLLSRIFPYIKPYLFRIILGFMVAIPLGLLDGVTAFALKPYMDYVIGGKSFAVDWHGISFSINPIQMAFILPIGVILFAAFQGVLRYLNGYLSMAINLENTNIDYNKEFFKIDLPQEKKRAFEIYDKYEGGKQLFPDDYATQAANMINDKLEYGRNINHDIFLKYCKPLIKIQEILPIGL